MGLVPERLAISELEADEATKSELLQASNEEASPIESVELFRNEDERRLVMNLERGALVIETSISQRWTRIDPRPSVA